MKTWSQKFIPPPSPLPPHTLHLPPLKAWFRALGKEGDLTTATALVAQVVEGCPPPKLVALIARNNEASRQLIAAAHLIATVPSNQGALLAAGLPAALIALIASEAPPSQRPARTHPVSHNALLLLLTLLRGRGASATTDVVIAAGGVLALAAALPAGGKAGDNAAQCLLSLTKLAPHRAAEIAAGAVPALLAAVKSGEEGGGGKAAAAHALFILMADQAVVEAEVIAAGLDVAALRGLAGLPPLPPPS